MSLERMTPAPLSLSVATLLPSSTVVSESPPPAPIPAFPSVLTPLTRVDYQFAAPIPLPQPLRAVSVLHRAQADGYVQRAVDALEHEIRVESSASGAAPSALSCDSYLESQMLRELIRQVESLREVSSLLRDVEHGVTTSGKVPTAPIASSSIARIAQSAQRGLWNVQSNVHRKGLQNDLRIAVARSYRAVGNSRDLFSDILGKSEWAQSIGTNPAAVDAMLAHEAELVLLAHQNEQISRSNALHDQREEQLKLEARKKAAVEAISEQDESLVASKGIVEVLDNIATPLHNPLKRRRDVDSSSAENDGALLSTGETEGESETKKSKL